MFSKLPSNVTVVTKNMSNACFYANELSIVTILEFLGFSRDCEFKLFLNDYLDFVAFLKEVDYSPSY